MAGVWMNNNGIRRPDYLTLDVGNAEKDTYGKTKAEPDVVIMDSASRNPIAIIEVEVTHRSGTESKRQTARYFQNDSVKLLMLVKVHPRRFIDQ